MEQASIVNPTTDYIYDLAQAEVEVSPTTTSSNNSSGGGVYASGVREESRGRSSTKSTVSMLLICALYWTVYVYIYYSMYYNYVQFICVCIILHPNLLFLLYI